MVSVNDLLCNQLLWLLLPYIERKSDTGIEPVVLFVIFNIFTDVKSAFVVAITINSKGI